MVPTFIIDWPILILIGLAFSYGVRGEHSGSLVFSRAWISGKLIVTAFVGIVYYSYLLAPDWMWMYFVPADSLPAWMVFYGLILYYFAYASGFFVGREIAKLSKLLPIVYILLMLAAEGAIIYALRDRYLVVGSLAEFKAGTAVPLAESSVGGLPSVLSALLIPLSLVLILWSRRQKG